VISTLPTTYTLDAVEHLIRAASDERWPSVKTEAVADNARVIAWDNKHDTVTQSDVIAAVVEELNQ